MIEFYAKMFRSKIFHLIVLPLISSAIKFVNCSNQALTNRKPVVLVPLTKYNTDGHQVLSFDHNSNIRLHGMGDLSEAIENAVNLILEIEKETSPIKNRMSYNQMTNQKINLGANYNQVNNFQSERNAHPQLDQQFYLKDNQMNHQNRQNFRLKQYDDRMNQDAVILNSKLPYNQMANSYSNEDKNMNNFNQQEPPSNQIISMMKSSHLAMNNMQQNNGQVLDRNQRYVKRLICRTRKHKKMLESQYPIGSNTFSNEFKGELNSQIVRYPVFVPTYMTNYDGDLTYRLYNYRNIFI